MKIGTTNYYNVYWNKSDNTIRVPAINVLIVGVKSYNEAIKKCKDTFINFKAF